VRRRIHEQFYSRDSSDARDHGLGDLIGVPNLPNGTVLEISFFCCSPTSEEGSRYSTQVVNKPPSETEIYFKSLKPSKAESAFCSILPDRAGLSLEQTPSAGLAALAMSFTRVEGSEEAATDETFPHHALSTTHVLGYPFQVLTRAKPEFKINMIQKVKSVTAKNVKTCAGCL
jgi:hypothetical protein